MAEISGNGVDKKLRKACWIPGEEHEKDKGESEEFLKILDNELKGKKFFEGDSIGLADTAANCIAIWFGIITEVVRIELLTNKKFPKFNSSFKEYLPERDKFTEVSRARFLEAGAAKS